MSLMYPYNLTLYCIWLLSENRVGMISLLSELQYRIWFRFAEPTFLLFGKPKIHDVKQQIHQLHIAGQFDFVYAEDWKKDLITIFGRFVKLNICSNIKFISITFGFLQGNLTQTRVFLIQQIGNMMLFHCSKRNRLTLNSTTV